MLKYAPFLDILEVRTALWHLWLQVSLTCERPGGHLYNTCWIFLFPDPSPSLYTSSKNSDRDLLNLTFFLLSLRVYPRGALYN